MNFFTNFYNKVFSFFKQQEALQEDNSVKDVARSRLKLVLMQDRTNLTPKILEQMRGELIDLLSKYVELDKELLELNFEQEGDQVALMLSIPVIRAKDEQEIEEALKKAEQEKNKASESSEEEGEAGSEENSEEAESETTEETEVANTEETVPDNTENTGESESQEPQPVNE